MIIPMVIPTEGKMAYISFPLKNSPFSELIAHFPKKKQLFFGVFPSSYEHQAGVCLALWNIN